MTVVVIGALWGDEGKGKIVDFLAEDADVIARFGGGANAGHTISVDGVKYALHLIPSGILYEKKRVLLGGAMVIDPEALFAEIAMLEERGVRTAGRIFIAENAHLVLPSYKAEEQAKEAARAVPIGTTGRGIGVAYAKKALREGVRLADLDDEAMLAPLTSDDKLFIAKYAAQLKALSVNTEEFWDGIQKPCNILLEGAQGALLDIDGGTYPYVSSGPSCAAGAGCGTGLGISAIDKVIGVFKAYSTRVGGGPFPTEFTADESGLCSLVREKGFEVGVTTGRPRRCGHLDLVALRYVCKSNSLSALALTHLDVLDTLDEIKAAVRYSIDGEDAAYFPLSASRLSRAKPVYKTFKGWKTSLKNITHYDDLPPEAKAYISFIEDFCGTPCTLLAAGPERSDMIARDGVWV